MAWIKLHTKFLEWGWADDPNMVSVFIHLLLKANYKDTEWHGVVIKRGQLVTSREMLSRDTGISQQSIRTCLSRLELTGEIIKKSTNKFTLITICKYDNYQVGKSKTNQQPTNK